MTKYPAQKQGLTAATFFSLHSIKGLTLIIIVTLIVAVMSACYFFERATEIKRLARPQKKKFHPRRLDEYLSSIGDKKINELLIAKHHEPIHPN